MAKAIAICTCKKCGKTFEKRTVKTNRREADRWEEWAERTFDLCQACEEDEHKEQARVLAAKAADAGLPVLQGSQKQVVWAEQLRGTMMDMVAQEIDKAKKSLADQPEALANIDKTFAWIRAQSAAQYWIENRVYDGYTIVKDAYTQMLREQEENKRKMPEEVAEETTVVPENQTHGTVELIVKENRIAARYPKDDTFREIVKSCKLHWDSVHYEWARDITQFAGSATDRAADLANRLLRNGFAVCCQNETVKQLAVSAQFEPECERWLSLCTTGKYAGWLMLSLDPARTLYQDAIRLHDAQYAGGKIMLPVAQWILALDFAQINSYKVSDGARQAIDRYEAERMAAVMPNPPECAEQGNALQDILNSDGAVLADLVDE